MSRRPERSGVEWSHPLFFSGLNKRWLDFARHDTLRHRIQLEVRLFLVFTYRCDASVVFSATLAIGCAASRARFSSRTLTRGSPRNPSWRPSVCLVINWRTASSLMPRSRATRGTWNSAPAGVMSGIESGSRGCQQIDWHRLARILRLQPGEILFETVDELLIGRAQI